MREKSFFYKDVEEIEKRNFQRQKLRDGHCWRYLMVYKDPFKNPQNFGKYTAQTLRLKRGLASLQTHTIKHYVSSGV